MKKPKGKSTPEPASKPGPEVASSQPESDPAEPTTSPPPAGSGLATSTRRILLRAETPAAREEFLAQLRQGLPVSAAAAKANVDRQTVYNWREADSNFRKKWDDAYVMGSEAIEEEARRRAIDGWDENGVHRYSDRLLER
jgi:hypothetical protein